MRRILFVIGLMLCARSAFAFDKYNGSCEQGGGTVTTAGLTSSTFVQRSYKVCTVTVYSPPGQTSTLATLYSDNGVTPLANPFTNQVSTTGQFFFYAVASHVDIRIAATGLTTYTLGDVTIGTPGLADCSNFPGATAGAKIAACITSLPSTGGIADARGIQGAQTISQNMFSGITKPVRLLLGNAVFSMSVGQIIVAHGTSVIGSCAFTANCTQFTATAAIVLFTVKDNAGSFSENIRLEDFYVNCASTGTSGLLIYNNHDSRYSGLRIDNCTTAAYDLRDEEYANTFTNIQGYTNAIGIKLSLANATTIQKLVFINAEMYTTTAENVFITAGQDISFLGGSFEVGTAGIAITGLTQDVTVIGANFEHHTNADVYCYKSSGVTPWTYDAASLNYGGRGITLIGNVLHGNNTTSQYGVRVLGCSGVNITGVYTDQHTVGGLSFSNTGLTNYLGKGNLCTGCNLNEGVSLIPNSDGLSLINQLTQNYADDSNFLNYRNGRFVVNSNGTITNTVSTAAPALSLVGPVPIVTLNDTGSNIFAVRVQGNELIFRDVNNAVDALIIDPGSGGIQFKALNPMPFVFADIATILTSNGKVGYCSDCNIANPCTGAGTGAIAKRLNGAMVCN